jgi:hypothetical protein
MIVDSEETVKKYQNGCQEHKLFIWSRIIKTDLYMLIFILLLTKSIKHMSMQDNKKLIILWDSLIK